MATPPAFLIHMDTEPMLKILPPEEVGLLFLSLFEYVRERKIPEGLPPTAMVAFWGIKHHVDHNLNTYDAKCQRNSENGKKGGRPKKVNSISEEETPKTQKLFEKANTNTSTNTSTNTNTNTNTKEEEQSCSPPPSSPPPLPEKELEELGIPLTYAEERIERAEHFAKAQKKSVTEVLSDWWQTDKAGTPPNKKAPTSSPPPSEHRSYDLDDFIETALRRSEEEQRILAEQDRLRHK